MQMAHYLLRWRLVPSKCPLLSPSPSLPPSLAFHARSRTYILCGAYILVDISPFRARLFSRSLSLAHAMADGTRYWCEIDEDPEVLAEDDERIAAGTGRYKAAPAANTAATCGQPSTASKDLTNQLKQLSADELREQGACGWMLLFLRICFGKDCCCIQQPNSRNQLPQPTPPSLSLSHTHTHTHIASPIDRNGKRE